MVDEYDKKTILKSLKLFDDEPAPDSDLFGFKEYSNSLVNLIMDNNTPTPYSIALHGEWGSGKTSLLLKTHNQLKDEIKKQNLDWKVVWFNAWEYERLDPVAALFQLIASAYDNQKAKFVEIAKNIGFALSKMVVNKVTGVEIDDIIKQFQKTVEEIPTIRESLEELIGNGKLIVIVDDLDRCIVENSLSILETIKLFLNAKGAIFVMGVDMAKLERAWELRYHGQGSGITEGREHVDKIFQLKLALPPKYGGQIEEFIEGLIQNVPADEGILLQYAFKDNPRQVKRILSLIGFLVKSTKKPLQQYLVFIIFWSIIASLYPKVATIFFYDPDVIPQVLLICREIQTYDDEEYGVAINKLAEGSKTDKEIRIDKLKIDPTEIYLPTITALREAKKYSHGIEFLGYVAKHFFEDEGNVKFSNAEKVLLNKEPEFYQVLDEVITRGGLVGYIED